MIFCDLHIVINPDIIIRTYQGKTVVVIDLEKDNLRHPSLHSSQPMMMIIVITVVIIMARTTAITITTILLMIMITHNSVHMVEEVFVGSHIIGVVGADHFLDNIRDETHLCSVEKVKCRRERIQEHDENDEGQEDFAPVFQEHLREDRRLQEAEG